MPSWNELLADLSSQPDDDARGAWMNRQMSEALSAIGAMRGDEGTPRNVIFYGSAFLQQPAVPGPWLSITAEDLNGLMATMHGMDWDRHLTLILHTPGGVTSATESIVSYLRSKFTDIEVIVPLMAMSAGTMISLAANRIVMGRQSQLGPIDPQMVLSNRSHSARAIVEQYDRAAAEILENPRAAHVWAPILSSLGPALLQEAQNALDYSERMVAGWIANGMLKGKRGARNKGQKIAYHFNDATTHKSHSRRIGRDEARAQGVVVEDLESNQDLQESVLTLYHLMTLLFEQTPQTKVIQGSHGKSWAKRWTPPQ